MSNLVQKNTKKETLTNRYLVWDAHSCLPLTEGEPLSDILRHKRAGYDYVSVNIGMDKQSIEQIFKIVTYLTDFINKKDSGCTLVGSISELKQAQRNGLLAISFDLEGLEAISHDLSVMDDLYRLGLRQVLFAYNQKNKLCGGCLTPNFGLTPLGVKAVEKANELGILLDCSHISAKASKEIMKLSSQPVIFSHSNPYTLYQHARNITDEQILACAEKGGVIGLNGIGVFIGENKNDTKSWFSHFEYVVDLVGWEYTGIGLDYCYSEQEMAAFSSENKAVCQSYQQINMVAPEQLSELIILFEARGYSKAMIEGILGGNFLRVASNVWRN